MIDQRGPGSTRWRRAWRSTFGHVVGLVALLLIPTDATPQSLLAADGLGLVAEPLDARSRALGGAGIGLSGSYLSDRDPAASAGLSISTAAVTFQASSITDAAGGSAGHTRFPTLAASYPYLGSVFFVQVASVFDQEWEARFEQTLQIGEEPVGAVDRFRSTGGVGRASVGWARNLAESVSVGVAFGTYVGTTERRFSRALDPEVVGVDVQSFQVGRRLKASGLVYSAGATWDPIPLLRVSGSAAWSGDLLLSPSDDGPAGKGRYQIPLQVRGGGTVTLTAALALHFGLTFSDWSDTELAEGTSRGSTLSYGGGLEWSGATLFGRPLPIRLGARHRDLPFHSDGNPTSERSLSGGIGMDLVDTAELPLARLEFGYERGSRKAGSFSEDFRRTVVSVRVSAG